MALLDRRARTRAATIDEIKSIAREQIASEGAASLSLGAIARAMGMTTPALYRYFDSRAMLMTELTVEAYHSLADALEGAVASLPPTAYAGRFRALLMAYREWAISSPDYDTLIHGAPSGHTAATDARTRPAVLRSLRLIACLLQEADERLTLRIPKQYATPPTEFQQQLETLQTAFPDGPVRPALLTMTIMLWIKVHGLVWQELHGNVAANLLQGGGLYQMEVEVTCEQLQLIDLNADPDSIDEDDHD